MRMNTFGDTLLILLMQFSYVAINTVEIKPGLISANVMVVVSVVCQQAVLSKLQEEA